MRFFKIFPVLALLALMVACGDDDAIKLDPTALEAWTKANEQAINDIAKNPEYTEIVSPGNNGSIYYKVLKEGTGEKQIFFTSQVTVYYKGWFVADYEDLSITKGKVFDHQVFDDGTPVVFAVSPAGSTLVTTSNYSSSSYYYSSYYSYYSSYYDPPSPIEGWVIALQYMKKGDKWEIWIPARLAYGESGSSDSSGNITIPPNSTLVFEIEIVNVKGIDGDVE